MKVFRWDVASSLRLPENCSFISRFNKAALISQDSALAVGGAINVVIKSLLLVLEKSNNLVFSWDIVTTQTRSHANKRSNKKKANKKKANIFVFSENILEVGEMKMRGKWKTKVIARRWEFVHRNLIDVDDVSPATALEIGKLTRDYLDLILLGKSARNSSWLLVSALVIPQRGVDEAAQQR
jgi:hypothetical protein